MSDQTKASAAPTPGGQPTPRPGLENEVEERVSDLENTSLDVAARTLESVNVDIRRVLEEIR